MHKPGTIKGIEAESSTTSGTMLEKVSLERKTRVLTVIRYPVGGIRTYLKYTYGNLDKSRYRFTILALHDSEAEVMKKDLDGFDLEWMEIKGRLLFLKFVFQIFTMLLTRRFDLVHSQGSSCGLVVSGLTLFFRIPHIVTLHETFDDSKVGGRFKSFKRGVISFLFSRASFLNVVSQDAKLNLMNYFPSLSKHPSKVVEIRSGVDVGYFRAEIKNARSIRDIEGIGRETFVIGYLGRFMPEKGFQVLIDAVEIFHTSKRSHRDFKVLALGWGAFIREYQGVIKEKGLGDYFVFIEFQPDVRWVLRQIDLLVIPSLREALGLVAVEGLISGTPIIASDCIGLREVLQRTPARLVKPGEPAELAVAITRAVQKPWKEEAVQFIPEAVRRFSAKSAAEQLELLFRNAVKTNGDQPRQ